MKVFKSLGKYRWVIMGMDTVQFDSNPCRNTTKAIFIGKFMGKKKQLYI